MDYGYFRRVNVAGLDNTPLLKHLLVVNLVSVLGYIIYISFILRFRNV